MPEVRVGVKTDVSAEEIKAVFVKNSSSPLDFQAQGKPLAYRLRYKSSLWGISLSKP
jgi:hypothetical protein